MPSFERSVKLNKHFRVLECVNFRSCNSANKLASKNVVFFSRQMGCPEMPKFSLWRMRYGSLSAQSVSCTVREDKGIVFTVSALILKLIYQGNNITFLTPVFNWVHVIYIIKVTVCVRVLYRRPHRWTYRAQIWHGGPHLPQGGYRIHFVPEHLPPRWGEAKEWFWRSVQPKRCISVKIS